MERMRGDIWREMMTEENENMIDMRMERSDLDMTFAEIEFGQRAGSVCLFHES